jgi:hypothetical protein
VRFAAAIAAVAVLSVTWGQGLGSWAVDGAGRGAVLEAFAYPAGVAAEDVALIVFCDADVPGGLNVNVWLGRPTGVAWPTSFEAATRRDQDAVRRDRWSSDGDRLAAPFDYGEVGRVIDDLRRGGSFAVRAFVLEGVDDAAQPTYQFSVDGFAVAERQLGCAGEAPPTPPAASPPPAPTPPAAPPSRAPSARSATPPAPAPAPSNPAPAPAPRPVVPWVVDGPGDDPLAFAFGADAGLYVACVRGAPTVLFEVVSGPAFGRDFQVRLSGFARLLDREPFQGPVDVLVDGGDPSFGFLALDVSAATEMPIEVEAVFPDDSAVPLLAVEGGGGFYAALDQLPCGAIGAAPAPAAVLVATGSWVSVLDGAGLAYEDPTVDAYLSIACFDDGPGVVFTDPSFDRPRGDVVRFRFAGSAVAAQEYPFVSLGGGRYVAEALVAVQIAYQAFFERAVAVSWAGDPVGRTRLVFSGGDALRARYEALPCAGA